MLESSNGNGPSSTTLDDLREFFLSTPPNSNSSLRTSFPQFSAYLKFYDQHLDTRLDLKTVVEKPSLLGNLAKIIEARLKSLEDNGIDLPSTDSEASFFPGPKHRKQRYKFSEGASADTIAYNYAVQAHHFCGTVSSTLYFAQELHFWRTALEWSIIDNSQSHPLLVDHYGVRINISSNPFTTWDLLLDESKAVLSRARDHCGEIAIFQFFDDCPLSTELLEELSGTPTKSFRPTFCGATNPIHEDLASTPVYGDENNSLIINRLLDQAEVPITSIQSLKPAKKRRKPKSFSEVELPPSQIPRSSYITRQDLASIILRRAWARAVAANCSFIVFNSGSFERIGVRDRQHQTLYISELMKVRKPMNPGYHQVHTGLHLAMLEDIIQRTNMYPVPMEKPKQRQIFRGTQTRSQKNMVQELRNRKLALIRMKYNGLCSPSPAAFLRAAAREELPGTTHEEELPAAEQKFTYDPKEYFVVTFTSEIAAGGTGIAHEGFVEVPTTDNQFPVMNVVTKVAFSPDQCRRLRREYAIYQKLHQASVEGIPRVYGVFEDVESGALAMIMDHAGECLLTLFPNVYERGYDHWQDIGNPTVLSHLESRFSKILKDIHCAGFFHRDIRGENLTMDPNGNVYIIDFDRAKPDPTDEDIETDLTSLEATLSGQRSEALFTPSIESSEDQSDSTAITPTPRKRRRTSSSGSTPMDRDSRTSTEESGSTGEGAYV